nr:MAG TPA: hypothetical protein [Caudoviricetes sp.]
MNFKLYRNIYKTQPIVFIINFFFLALEISSKWSSIFCHINDLENTTKN